MSKAIFDDNPDCKQVLEDKTAALDVGTDLAAEQV